MNETFIIYIFLFGMLICISFFLEKWNKRALRRASFARPSYRTLLRSSILPGRRVNGPAGRARSLRESVPLHAVFPPVNIPRQISIPLTFTTVFTAEERERCDAHAIFAQTDRSYRFRTPPRRRLARECASVSRTRASARRLPLREHTERERRKGFLEFPYELLVQNTSGKLVPLREKTNTHK